MSWLHGKESTVTEMNADPLFLPPFDPQPGPFAAPLDGHPRQDSNAFASAGLDDHRSDLRLQQHFHHNNEYYHNHPLQTGAQAYPLRHGAHLPSYPHGLATPVTPSSFSTLSAAFGYHANNSEPPSPPSASFPSALSLSPSPTLQYSDSGANSSVSSPIDGLNWPSPADSRWPPMHSHLGQQWLAPQTSQSHVPLVPQPAFGEERQREYIGQTEAYAHHRHELRHVTPPELPREPRLALARPHLPPLLAIPQQPVRSDPLEAAHGQRLGAPRLAPDLGYVDPSTLFGPPPIAPQQDAQRHPRRSHPMTEPAHFPHPSATHRAADSGSSNGSGGRRRAESKKTPIMACFFCRNRKIACGPPPPESTDRSCDQCKKRGQRCEYPTVSRRGQRKRKPNPDDPSDPSPPSPNVKQEPNGRTGFDTNHACSASHSAGSGLGTV